MDISLSPKRLAQSLMIAIAILLVGHAVGLFFKFGLGHESVFNLVPLFDVRLEQNFPTFYSSLALLLCAFLLSIIGIHKRTARHDFVKHWFLLAAVFVYLSCDEIMTIHEDAIPIVKQAINAEGLLYFAWVVPYGAAVILFALAYIPFLLSLPRRFAKMFITAGTIYVAGAIGFESLSAAVYFDSRTMDAPLFVLYYTIEETLEMVGVLIFAYALSSYICSEIGGFRITLEQRN
jgi:hypothetical protein